MIFGVPQYIDIEDKLVGPFTAKQLGWLILLGTLLLILWKFIDSRTVFFIIAVPTLVIIGGMAFYRPYGQPLSSFFMSGVLFCFGSKIYVWKRAAKSDFNVRKKNIDDNKIVKVQKRKMSEESLRSLAQLLDTAGVERSESALKIIKERKARTDTH